MRVSFAIPAHDEELLLPETLRAIREAAREVGVEHEIVVADDASADRTAAIAREAGARVVSIDRRKIAAARNAAARAANGDVLFFVDADTRIDAAVVREALAALANGCVAGGALVRFDGRIPWWGRALTALFTATFRIANLAAGCFMFCTRAAYEKSGGYDENLFAGEEVRFALALRRAGRFVLLRERVVTSGRKLRSYSLGEVLAALARATVEAVRAAPSRTGLELWYGPRRDDPGG